MAYKKVSMHRTLPGRFANYLATNSLQMPPGKFYAVCARQNYPDSHYLDRGASHVSTGWQPHLLDYIARFGTPKEKLSLFVENPWWIANYDRSKRLPQWSDDQARGVVQSLKGIIGGEWPNMLVTAFESYDDAFNWRPTMEYAGRQTTIIIEELGKIYDAFNGWFSMWYEGNFDLQFILNQNQAAIMGPAIASPNAALSFLKGYENDFSQYYKSRHWQNMALLQNSYWLNSRTDYMWFFKSMMQLLLNRMAMNADEVTRKRPIISYTMPEGIQLVGYSEIYPNVPFTAGTMLGSSHNLQSYTSHVACGCMEYFFADMRSQWSDSYRYGTDLGVIRGGTQNDDYESRSLIPNGQPIVTKPVLREYQPDGAGANREPYGLQYNGEEDGARWYQMIYQWTGTQNWRFVRYRTTVSGAAYCSLGTDYPVARYLEENPFAFLFEGVNGRKALFVLTPEGPWKTWQFDIGNASSPFEAELSPDMPHLFLIE